MAGQQFFDIFAMNTKGTKGPANANRLAVDGSGNVWISIKGAPFVLFGGFSSDVTVQQLNSLNALVDAMRDLTSFSVNTAGAEVGHRQILLARAGVLVPVIDLDGGELSFRVRSNLNTLGSPNFSLESSGTYSRIDLVTSAGLAGYLYADTQRSLHIGAGGAFGDLVFDTSIRWKVSTTVTPVATTVTLPFAEGSSYKMSVGTGTLNSIVVAGMNFGYDGAEITLTFPAGVTINHNTAGTGATILTPTGAAIVTASKRVIKFYFDGTNMIVVG